MSNGIADSFRNLWSWLGVQFGSKIVDGRKASGLLLWLLISGFLQPGCQLNGHTVPPIWSGEVGKTLKLEWTVERIAGQRKTWLGSLSDFIVM
jgi:hypothetical protein